MLLPLLENERVCGFSLSADASLFSHGLRLNGLLSSNVEQLLVKIPSPVVSSKAHQHDDARYPDSGRFTLAQISQA